MRPPRTHAPHIFVEDLHSVHPSDDDAHHLRVLRIDDGAPIVACDGLGGWRLCRYTSQSLQHDGGIEFVKPPPWRIGVAFALTKGDRPELVVQKLTEIGVDDIVPYVAQRSVVRWDGERAIRNIQRLRRVAREAAMQSRRVVVPLVDDLRSLAAVVGDGFALAEPGGEPLADLVAASFAPAGESEMGGRDLFSRATAPVGWQTGRPLPHQRVAIGPEGGFTPAELASASVLVDLGDGVLRAETAAIVAAAHLAALRRGWATRSEP